MTLVVGGDKDRENNCWKFRLRLKMSDDVRNVDGVRMFYGLKQQSIMKCSSFKGDQFTNIENSLMTL